LSRFEDAVRRWTITTCALDLSFTRDMLPMYRTAAMRAMPMSRGGVGAVRSARRTTIGPPLGAGVDTAPAPGGVSGRAGPGGIREERHLTGDNRIP
jgi:hypothetical protein